VITLEGDTFLPPSWLALFAGHQLWPDRYEPFPDLLPEAELESRFGAMKQEIRSAVETLPSHESFVRDLQDDRLRLSKPPELIGER